MKNIKINDNDNLLFNIGKAVFVARSRCGFTQAKLAKKVGTLQPGIARLENPASLPSLTLLKKVADALDQNVIFGFQPKNVNDQRFIKSQNLASVLPLNDRVNTGSGSVKVDIGNDYLPSYLLKNEFSSTHAD